MKTFSFNKVLKYLAAIMVVTQGIIVAFVTTSNLNAKYINRIKNYSNCVISIKSIPSERNTKVIDFIKEYSMQNGIFVVRQDLEISDENSLKGIILGLYGDFEKNSKEVELEYLGIKVIKLKDIKNLLENKDDDVVIGVEKSTLKSIGFVPRFKYGDNVVIKKLSQLVKETNTINGEYHIFGLNQDKKNKFENQLSDITGINKDRLFNNKSGYFLDRGLSEKLLWGILIVHSFILLAVFVVMTINSLQHLGKLMLQGWSKFNFFIKLYSKYLIIAFVSIFLFIFYGYLYTEGSFNSINFYSNMIAAGLVNFILIIFIALISSTFIFIVKPINAIKDRFPKKTYITLGVIVYIIFDVFLLLICSYIDGPYREIEKNKLIKSQWDSVSDFYILISISSGNDKSSFNKQSKDLLVDEYKWYKSISKDEDVKIINTSFYSNEMLIGYKKNKIYNHIPGVPQWIMRASPSYLNSVGINIDSQIIQKALNGERVYLLPNETSNDDRITIINWLIEKDTRSIRDDDIETIFNKEQNFSFIDYSTEKRIFSWSTNNTDSFIKPIILILTPNNMIFKESESLFAKGLQSSYIKMSKNSVDKYTNKEYLSKYNLEDNKISFLPIKVFVDGLQKNLLKTMELFFSLIFALTFVLVALLITLISVYKVTNNEYIFIKRFLGYSNLKIYKIPLLVILILNTLNVLIMILLKSKIGFFYVLFVGILQTVIIFIMITKNEFRKINDFLKS